MNIVVCVKQVPEVTDAELEVNKDGTEIITEDLEYDINEWDNYAVEEAVRIKEARGGKVTVVTLGDEDSEDVLRQALAMGAEEAIRVDEEDFELSDARGIAKGIFQAIKDLPFDLLLTGAQSSDNGWGQVGLALAELLGLPYASLVVGIEVGDDKLAVTRELEAKPASIAHGTYLLGGFKGYALLKSRKQIRKSSGCPRRKSGARDHRWIPFPSPFHW